MAIRYPPSLELARRDTPIEPLRRLSEGLPVEVWVKRDDLTGCELTGNKVRKLDFLLAGALAEGADTVITCGAVQSNHARATALAAARLGLRARLLLRGEPESAPTGNFLLDRLAGASVRHLSVSEWKRVDALLFEETDAIRGRGGRPYAIPEGGSNALGCLGYARVVEEIAAWSAREGVRFEAIAHATGSGGTTAGLALGKASTGYGAEVLGFAVCDDEAYFRARVGAILAEAVERFAPSLATAPDAYAVLDGYKGEGYARSSPEETAFLLEVAGREGLILDPVYTGKALRGLVAEIRRGRYRKGSRVLFVHTGGIFGLFAKSEAFAPALGRQ